MIILSGVLVVVAIALLVAGIVAGNGDSAQVFGVDAIVVIYTSIAVSLVSALCLLIGVFLRRKEIFGGGTATSRRDRKAAKGKKGKKGAPAGRPVPAGTAPQPGGDGDPDDEVAIPPQPVDVPDDAVVFVVRGRKRYHLDTCRQLAGREKEELTYVEAREEGFSPCTACLPDTALAARASVSVGGSSAAEDAKPGDAPSGAGPSGPVASAASPSAPPRPESASPSVPSAWPAPAPSTPPPAPSGRGDVTLPDIRVPAETPPVTPTLTDLPVVTPPEPAPRPEPEPEPAPEAAAPAKPDEAAETPSEPSSADETPEPEEKKAPVATVAEKAPAAPAEPEPAEEPEVEPAETAAPEATAPPRPRESADQTEDDAQAEPEASAADEPAAPEDAEDAAPAEPAAEPKPAAASAAGAAEPQVRILSGTKRYHRPDCALIEDIGDDAEDLETLPRSEAKERGCTPCLVCQPDREHARD
ncbi:hypothetical protein [Actinomadura rupiterrae]|uniref:hypothetical protein n=1 Tax=Actinomadura rupiterrae TaxID=559627 RepID=UPI0020A5C579|nr:hypothetical protein [Actinomadura rupiterrae]MCP2338281.1 hypothetical protein [Actinomadura rupiterrae]